MQTQPKHKFRNDDKNGGALKILSTQVRADFSHVMVQKPVQFLKTAPPMSFKKNKSQDYKMSTKRRVA